MISTMPFYPRDAVLTPSSDFDRVSVSVCLSQVGVLSKRMGGIIRFLAWGVISTCPTQHAKEIQVSAKITVVPSGTFRLNSGRSTFDDRYAVVKLSISLARERWSLQA